MGVIRPTKNARAQALRLLIPNVSQRTLYRYLGCGFGQIQYYRYIRGIGCLAWRLRSLSEQRAALEDALEWCREEGMEVEERVAELYLPC